MRLVVFSPMTQKDLLGIWDFIAEQDPQAADRLVDRLRYVAQRLGEYPFTGVAATWLIPGLRKKSVRGYLIFYRVDDKAVTVSRIIHAARNLSQVDLS